ncbi:MAG: acyltransferase [Deltaproteobacteria bacterium]|nr:acyltransferase [Deltaproteobacteria bacterium]
MLKKIYLSPIGRMISTFLNLASFISRPFMVYGYYNKVTKQFNKLTRISSNVVITDRSKFDIGDNSWIWHHSIIDSSNGVKIGKGCQIGAWVGIFTHGSHISIRLLGENYLQLDKHGRVGYQRGSVEIGEYTFIGAHSIVLPDVKIGKGCIVGARSMVTKAVPDYAIVSGNPAEIIGDTRKLDRKFLKNPEVRQTYYDQIVVEEYLMEKRAKNDDNIGKIS